MVKDIPAGWRISVMLPVRGRLQQYRLHSTVAFRCGRCGRDTTTQTVATLDWDWSAPMCESCHAKLSMTSDAEPIEPIVPEPWKPSVPKPRKPQHEEKAAPASATPMLQKRESWLGSPEKLHRNFKQLAAILRKRAAGAKLSPEDRQALNALADRPVFPVALRYAELLDEGEAMVGRHSGKATPTHVKTLTQQRIDAVRRFETRYTQRLNRVRGMSVVQDRLSIRVVRELTGDKYDRALASVLRKRGLRPDAISVPTVRLWSWLANAAADWAPGRTILPKAVRRLLDMHDDAFTQVVIADAKGSRPEAALEHPAVVERWAACSGKVEAWFQSARDQCDRALRGSMAKSQRSREIAKLRAVAHAYAMASARHLMANLALKDLRLQVLLTYGEEGFQRFRVARMMEAVEAIYRVQPALAAEVKRASAEHRQTCPRRSPHDSCLTCAPEIAAVVRKRLSSPVAAVVETQTGGLVLPAEATREAETPRCTGSLDSFACPDVRRHLSAEVGRMVGVTESRYDAGSGRYCFAWVTEYGEWGTGEGQAANAHDAWLQAVCRTALDLGGEVSRVHVICRDERAASVVQHVVKAQFVADALGFPVTDRTRELLVRLIRCRGKVSASANGCTARHRGATAAGRLADLALGAREPGGVEAVKAAGDEIAEEFRSLAETPVPGLTEENGRAHWVPVGSDAEELRWRAALRRVHLKSGWTALPDGLTAKIEDRQRLRLVVEHPARGSKAVQGESEVMLRRAGARWELHGVTWPPGILPGTVITYRWRPGERMIKASSELLPHPERVDDLIYQHRYDIRVVTRENAPGVDQDGQGHDLSDAAWVMRTLRVLGHLSADGSAILAEDALVDNCLELGLPQKRVARVPLTVERLVKERRIGRVWGSLDGSGQPSHPPRIGETRVQLLRYVPRLERLISPPVQRGGAPSHAKDHLVSGFVRRLPAGQQASDEQRELHQQAVRAKQVVNRPLPDGYTFVRPHRRRR